MCGIAGIAALSAQIQVSGLDVRRMLPALCHRGPDGSGVYLDSSGRIGLGHTRLSIIDLAGGAQPMANEDQTVWVSFNGEIFDYIELRETLLKAGHRFSTHSDTEVIVHAYEQYGDDFVQYLNGQFAIALWDANRRRLLLVRIESVSYRCSTRARAGNCCSPRKLRRCYPCWRKRLASRQRRWIKSLPSGHRTAPIPCLRVSMKSPPVTCWCWKTAMCASQCTGTGAFPSRTITFLWLDRRSGRAVVRSAG